MIALQSYYTFIHRSCDPRAKGYVLKSDFVAILHRQLGLNSQSGVDVPALAESLAVSNWVPYPKFLAMFEGEEPQDMTTDDTQTGVPVATVQPEKLKVFLTITHALILYRCILLYTA